jgi:DNA-binding MarR family transcriptional regulator
MLQHSNIGVSTAGCLRKLVEEWEKHPKDYTLGHILLTMFYTGEGSVSRAKLQRLLGLGEGSVKSMVKCMRKHGLLSTSASGSRLTNRGIEILKCVKLHIPELRKAYLEYLSVGRINYMAVLRGLDALDALKIRDMAVRFGGTGAVLLSIREGRFRIPYVADDLRNVSLRDHKELSKTSPRDEDYILVVGSENNSSALSAVGSILFDLLIVKLKSKR